MKVSYSRVSTFNQCQYKYKLRYVDKLVTVKNQDANNALYMGTALHEGLEKDLKACIKSYLSNYYVINDLNLDEVQKFKFLISKIKTLIPQGINEFEIVDDDFIGFIDLLVPTDKENVFDLYDFKYSNNKANYQLSPQLHLYKYFYEKMTGNKIRDMYFLFVPKVAIRQKKTEDLYQFRKRIDEELEKTFENLKFMKINYDPKKVISFLLDVKNLYECEDFKKNPSYLCNWCEYQNYCEKGYDYMILPKNERREVKIDDKPDFWIYADSYVGKSTFVDKLDNLLFINTDGNTDNTTSPVISISDEVIQNGRMTKRKLAWENFLDVVSELEKKDNDFERVCIDLVEDLYEHCRLYTYDKLGIEHEQDAGFGKGWDMVRTEFLSTMKRLKNIGYQIIYISKEIVNEINLKNGGKITTYKPNLNDKVANVLAGTVDLTMRAYMDGEDRILQLEKKENVFGGGRFDFAKEEIKLDMDLFLEEIKKAQEGKIVVKKDEEESSEDVEEESSEDEILNEEEEEITEDQEEEKEEEEKPKRRRRKKDEEVEEEKPARRTRRSRE